MSDSVLGESLVSEVSETGIAQSPLSPGAQLAQSRKAMGWSVEQVAAQLKLAARQIQSIEADDYASLPGMASVRGFVRAYAKLVKLEAGPLVAMISSEAGTEKRSTPARRELSAPFFDTRLPTKNRRAFSFRSLALVMGIGALVLLLLAQLMGWVPAWKTEVMRVIDGGVASPAVTSPVVQITAAVPIEKTVVTVPAPSVAESVASAQPAASTVQMAASTAPNAPLAPTTAQPALSNVAVAPPGNALILQLKQDSWVEMTRADGAVVVARLLKAGTQETFAVTGPVQLLVGNATGVDATLRGVALELKPTIGNTVRLNLK